jgi:hypothetical protein
LDDEDVVFGKYFDLKKYLAPFIDEGNYEFAKRFS